MDEYETVLINRCSVGPDGKTAYERCKGKKASLNGIEFGERVFRVKRNRNAGKLESKLKMSFFWG